MNITVLCDTISVDKDFSKNLRVELSDVDDDDVLSQFSLADLVEASDRSDVNRYIIDDDLDGLLDDLINENRSDDMYQALVDTGYEFPK